MVQAPETGKRILVLSPTDECLCLAAAYRPAWDEFRVGGATQIGYTLRGIVRDAETEPVSVVRILLSVVARTDKVCPELERLFAMGIRVEWFAGHADEGADNKKMLQALRAIRSERFVLHAAETLAEATGRLLIPLTSREGGSGQSILNAVTRLADPQFEDLCDYLRYRINLFFVLAMADPTPLRKAIDRVVAISGKGNFALQAFTSEERAAVDHCRNLDFPYIEGRSEPMLALKARTVKLAKTALSVLILGETGTGKEAVAFYLHQFSTRAAGPYVALNCAGLTMEFLQSELFGHRKGAFTGALDDKEGLIAKANGGTLFLDEIANMPLTVQAALLRFLQTRRYRRLGDTKEQSADVRIVAAAQPDLDRQMADGQFRKDLYYRIAGAPLRTPCLRDIPEDISRIARNIVHRHMTHPDWVSLEARNAVAKEFTDPVFTAYRWPGNARELSMIVRRRLECGDDVIAEVQGLVKQQNAEPGEASDDYARLFGKFSSPDQIKPARDIMKTYICNAFRQARDLRLPQKEMAKRLGMSINAIKSQLADKGQGEVRQGQMASQEGKGTARNELGW